MPAARCIFHALEAREDAERSVLTRTNLHHLAEPAALATDAARVLAQFFAPDDQRCDRLGRLDRYIANTRRKWRRRQSILLRPCAGAAGMEAVHHERRTGSPADTCQAVPSYQVQRPEIRCAFRRHSV